MVLILSTFPTRYLSIPTLLLVYWEALILVNRFLLILLTFIKASQQTAARYRVMNIENMNTIDLQNSNLMMIIIKTTLMQHFRLTKKKILKNYGESWRYFIKPRTMICFNLIQASMSLAFLITLCPYISVLITLMLEN